MSSKETRSSSKDKVVPSQTEQTNSLRVTTFHSQSETDSVRTLRADKLEGTQLSLDKRAVDKNEDEEGCRIPPPLFKKSAQDNEGGQRSPLSPTTQAKMEAAREMTRQQRAAHGISSSSEGGSQKPKQISQTGQWRDKNNQGKGTVPKIRRGLQRSAAYPLGARPVQYGREQDDDDTQLLAL